MSRPLTSSVVKFPTNVWGAVSLNSPSKFTGTALVFHGLKRPWPCRGLMGLPICQFCQDPRKISPPDVQGTITLVATPLPMPPIRIKARLLGIFSEGLWTYPLLAPHLLLGIPFIPPKPETGYRVADQKSTTAPRPTVARPWWSKCFHTAIQ